MLPFITDLKGAPPKLSYLKEVLPLLTMAGATDLLIEYEDMFPYWGVLQNISSKTAYPMQVCSIPYCIMHSQAFNTAAGDC